MARLKNGLAFVGIVWAVAASFVVFEVVALRGTEFMLEHPDQFAPVLLSRATQQSTACLVRSGEGVPATPKRVAEGRFGGWSLGLRVGQDAIARQSGAFAPERLAQSAAAVTQVAGILGVTAPGVFVPRQAAVGNAEFLAFVEADAQATAHQLATQYAPSACQMYKLGAFWGYSQLTRSVLRGRRPLFPVEIRHYARQAELAESLWRPMLVATPRDASSDRIAADISALTSAVTNQLVREIQ